MPRSGKEARLRLQQAAIDLFLERGFDEVTTAEIAERAGVTERTFFRHFPDKREVLFDGENLLAETMTRALDDVPEGDAPLPALLQAFRAVVPMLEGNRLISEKLGRIVSTTPGLRERQAAKGAHLVEMLTERLRDRGVDHDLAALGAQAGWAALTQAMRRWRIDPSVGLAVDLEHSFRQLHTLVTQPHEPGRATQPEVAAQRETAVNPEALQSTTL